MSKQGKKRQLGQANQSAGLQAKLVEVQRHQAAMRASARTDDADSQVADSRPGATTAELTGQAGRCLAWWQIGLRIVGWCLWLLVSYFLSALVIWQIVNLIRNNAGFNSLASTIWTAVLQLLQLIIFLAVLIVPPYRLGQRQQSRPGWGISDQLHLLGLTRRPNLNDAWPLLIGAAGYYLASFVTLRLLSLIIGPDFLAQSQNVGFNAGHYGWWEIGLVVLVLGVVTPLCEEIVFRGFLLGRLGRLLGFWPAAIIVSIIFALAHGQLNVGVTTCILSLIACYQRRRTGAIWAGVGLHMTINAIAAVIIYVLGL